MADVMDDSETININIINLFGDTVLRSLGQTTENFIFGLKAQMGPQSGTGESITVFLSRNHDSQAKCALYRVSDNSLVGITEERMFTYGNDWEEFVFNSPKPLLLANEWYYICVWGKYIDEPNTFYISMRLDNDIYDPGLWSRTETYGTWPDPIELVINGTRRSMSIYCTYTP